MATSLSEQAFRQHPVPSLLIDRRCVIVASSDSAGRLFGHEGASSIEGIEFAEATGTDAEGLMEAVIIGASVGFITLRIGGEDGEDPTRHRFSVTAVRRKPGRPEHFLLTLARDSSTQFIQLTNALNDANIKASRDLAAKDRLMLKTLEKSYERINRFSAMVAHDLKSPLRNVGSFLEILQDEHGHEISEEGLEVLGYARRSTAKMERLIVGLLNHARAKRAGLNVQRVDLAKSVESVQEELQNRIDECDGHVALVMDAPAVTADPMLFEQLLSNLIENALKYRAPSRSPRVRVAYRVSGSKQELRVVDNGMGFDSAYSEKILEPFQRLNSTKVEGSGLGLATCKAICDLHGWVLRCEGRVDVGAEFIVTMP